MKIHPHGRLQEWVADDRGYFTDEGLEYELVPEGQTRIPTDRDDSGQITTGAYETYEEGRRAGVSCACHWAVNTAAANQFGKLVSTAYTVTPSAVVVAPESPIARPDDLAGVEVGVGYHSGSHFATLQAVEAVLPAGDIRISFQGSPLTRLDALVDRSIQAATVYGVELYVAQALGFRAVLDTTFMIAFLVNDSAGDPADVDKYLNGMKRAQMEIDLHGERYKHFYLKSVSARYQELVDVRQFGPGERIVFLPYTGETYQATQSWIREHEIFQPAAAPAAYESVVAGPAGE